MVQPNTDEAEMGTALDDEALPKGVGRRVISVDDPEIELWIPVDDVDTPEFSIVIPAMNEAITISTFVEWCRSGLRDAGVTGEILIIDSSSDDTPHLAVQGGARVLRTPKRGLGRAYIDAIPFIRGDYVIMGDADCTYDFRELDGFVQAAREGHDFVMGTRWKGYIEPGSMPPHHRYFGSPLTTRILNIVMSTKFSDIHCGMRMISTDALVRMGLQAQSWEYASEMILKSVHMRLRTSEVPVRFLKDPDGRESHLKRIGWRAPFHAGWISLRIMFVLGAEFFLVKPGIAMLVTGSAINLATFAGAVTVGPVTLSIFWKLVGATLVVLGLQSFCMGQLARVLFDYEGRFTEGLLDRFRYNRIVALSVAGTVGGAALASPLAVEYVQMGLALDDIGTKSFLAVSGMVLILVGFILFTSTLLIHAAASTLRRTAI